MNVKIENIETNVVKLEITVAAEEFTKAINKAYAKNVKKFNIPGFRKGKAPLSIIKKLYGIEVFYADAEEICINDTLPEAMFENKVRPVDRPEIQIIESGEGKDLVYTAKVTVVPEVTLGEYKGVEVKKIEYPVTEEEINNQLKEVQEKNARVESKEDGEIEKGNLAVIDFDGYIAGEQFEGGKAEDYTLEIGSGSFIGNFEDQLVGLKKDESKDVVVTFPEDYGKAELNGKEATFKVTVKDIKVKELPAIDDEFAKEVSEFDTLEEYREDLKKKTEEMNSEKAKAEFEEKVVEVVCENAKLEIPNAMIENEIDSMLKELEGRLQGQGLDLKTYYQFTNTTEEKVRDYMKETAEKRVKNELVLAEVAKVEKIDATEEELMEKAMELAKQWGNEELEKTAKLLLDAQKDYIKYDVMGGKVIDLLVTNAKIIE